MLTRLHNRGSRFRAAQIIAANPLSLSKSKGAQYDYDWKHDDCGTRLAWLRDVDEMSHFIFEKRVWMNQQKRCDNREGRVYDQTVASKRCICIRDDKATDLEPEYETYRFWKMPRPQSIQSTDSRWLWKLHVICVLTKETPGRGIN